MKFSTKEKNLKVNDNEGFYDPNQGSNFKGIFYGVDTDKKYFEGGAHFSFKDLCRRLEKLSLTLNHAERETNISNPNDNNKLNEQYKMLYNINKNLTKNSRNPGLQNQFNTIEVLANNKFNNATQEIVANTNYNQIDYSNLGNGNASQNYINNYKQLPFEKKVINQSKSNSVDKISTKIISNNLNKTSKLNNFDNAILNRQGNIITDGHMKINKIGQDKIKTRNFQSGIKNGYNPQHNTNNQISMNYNANKSYDKREQYDTNKNYKDSDVIRTIPINIYNNNKLSSSNSKITNNKDENHNEAKIYKIDNQYNKLKTSNSSNKDYKNNNYKTSNGFLENNESHKTSKLKPTLISKIENNFNKNLNSALKKYDNSISNNSCNYNK